MTILFADLASSTALGERLDPEQVRTVVGRFFEHMESVVTQYGGTVEKFVGDEVMAIFGLPAAHEDDPARAVHAAQAMQTKLQELNAELQRTHRLALQMRIGINTGEVVADPQAAEKGEFMVTGDAVNVAARLRSAAAPGTAVVGERTYRETTWLADYSACPPFALKGKSEPVVGWQLTGLRPEPARPTPGLRASLIGRQEEFALLQSVLQRVLRERRPHLVTVLGMPGVGKSRLVEELLGSAAGVAVRQGRSLAYASTSLWAVAEMIRTDCGILRSDPVAVMDDKLQRRVRDLIAEEPVREQIGGQLERVLAIRAADQAIPAEETRENLFWSIRRYVEAIAARSPLILVFDDIHWADAELLDLIEYLAQWVAGVPVLLIGMARPELLETRSAWGGGKRNYTSLFLEPLTETDTDRLLRELLRTDEPPVAVISAVGVAEGNPFFVEEILRMMIDAGALYRQNGNWTAVGDVRVNVPGTVQGVVTARIDQLQREEKEALLEASVLGKDFWAGALAHISGRHTGSLDSVLETLLVKDFFVERARSRLEGQREFTFKHIIIRDTAYQMLPKARRAEQHRAFGGWLEQTLQERSEAFVELLAHHWLQAARLGRDIGQPDQWRDAASKALQHTLTAGRKAARIYANEQAITHFQTAHELASTLGADGDRIAAIEGMADVHALQAEWNEASRLYQEALDFYQRKADPVRQARVQSRIGSTFSGIFDFRKALPHIQSAVETLEAGREEQELAAVHTQMARVQAYLGNFQKAEEYGRSALMLAEKHRQQILIAEARLFLGWIEVLTGRPEAARNYPSYVGEIERLNDRSRAVVGYHGMTFLYRVRGEYPQALEAGKRALALASEMTNRPRIARSLFLLGTVHFLAGNWPASSAAFQQYLAMSDAVPTWIEYSKSFLALFAGDLNVALTLAEQAITQAERRAEIETLGSVVDWCAFLYLRTGRSEQARHFLTERLAQFTPMGLFSLPYLYPLAAEAALTLGDTGGADEHVRQAEGYLWMDMKPARARVLKAKGLVGAAQQSWDAGIYALGAAVDLYAQIGQPYDRALCLEALASVLAHEGASGDTVRAAESLREAVAIHHQLGADFEVRRLQESAILK